MCQMGPSNISAEFRESQKLRIIVKQDAQSCYLTADYRCTKESASSGRWSTEDNQGSGLGPKDGRMQLSRALSVGGGMHVSEWGDEEEQEASVKDESRCCRESRQGHDEVVVVSSLARHGCYLEGELMSAHATRSHWTHPSTQHPCTFASVSLCGRTDAGPRARSLGPAASDFAWHGYYLSIASLHPRHGSLRRHLSSSLVFLYLCCVHPLDPLFIH